MRVAVIAPLLLGACLEVPQASCPAGGDFDEDGWPCGGVAPDCDDGDPAIHPGIADDCTTIVVEDCGGEALDCPAEPVGLEATTEPGASTWTVRGGGLTATFEDAFHWVLASLKLGNDPAELLSRQPAYAEQFVGVTLFPGFDQWDVTDAAPEVLDAGPAYVRIRLTWANDVSNEVADGVSTFGFFPNATIHRHETFVTDTGYGAANLYLVTHWTVNTAHFSGFVGNQGEVDLTMVDGQMNVHTHLFGQPDEGVMCAFEPEAGRRVAMAWRDQDGAEGSRAVRGGEQNNPRLALNYDTFRDEPIGPGTYESVTAFAVDAPDAAGSACASATTLATEIREPPALTFVAGLPGEHAGVDGYVVTEGVYEVEAEADEPFVEVIVNGPRVRGMLVRALLDDVGNGVTVWRNGERARAGLDYLVQPSDGGVTVYLRDPIDEDDTLRIAAPGGEPT